MKTEFNFKEYKVGGAVYHVTRGWTTIESIEKDYFEVENDGCAFFLDGKINTIDSYPTIYPYNPFEKNEEREIEVSNGGENWVKRTLIKRLDNSTSVLCWNYERQAIVWDRWREIQPQKELTFEEKVNILWKKHENELWILKLKK